jgi:hypothetical protein
MFAISKTNGPKTCKDCGDSRKRKGKKNGESSGKNTTTLFLYRHSYIGFTSAFASSIHNKQQKFFHYFLPHKTFTFSKLLQNSCYSNLTSGDSERVEEMGIRRGWRRWGFGESGGEELRFQSQEGQENEWTKKRTRTLKGISGG